jgi:hypothetical protein
MCYIDVPASELDSSPANQLTMPVEAGTPATARYGNTGTAIPDTLNNVQKVVWENIPQTRRRSTSSSIARFWRWGYAAIDWISSKAGKTLL